tara:strand:+ start:262 stop:729 length:468 start_codon:yes stop_codon:yes gene_type:complete
VVTLNMQIEVSAVKGALDQIKRRIPSATSRGMAKAGAFIQEAIKNRTRKGQDFKGRQFRPYSASYAKKRSKEGRTQTPNLFYSGQMFSNMTYKKMSQTKGQIFFPNRTQNLKAFYNDTLGVGKADIRREFFSVSAKEEAKAVKIFTETFERELRL